MSHQINIVLSSDIAVERTGLHTSHLGNSQALNSEHSITAGSLVNQETADSQVHGFLHVDHLVELEQLYYQLKNLQPPSLNEEDQMAHMKPLFSWDKESFGPSLIWLSLTFLLRPSQKAYIWGGRIALTYTQKESY